MGRTIAGQLARGVAMTEPVPRDLIETCRRRARNTRDFAETLVKGKAQQALLALAEDYDRAAEALARGEEIDPRIQKYLSEDPG